MVFPAQCRTNIIMQKKQQKINICDYISHICSAMTSKGRIISSKFHNTVASYGLRWQIREWQQCTHSSNNAVYTCTRNWSPCLILIFREVILWKVIFLEVWLKMCSRKIHFEQIKIKQGPIFPFFKDLGCPDIHGQFVVDSWTS